MPTTHNDDLSAWLKNAGRYELLKPADELILARAIELGRDANATQKQRRDAQRARDRLIACNLRLVYSIAKKSFPHATPGHSAEDMLQNGVEGLARAADLYDHRRGYKFSTYATWWIRQAVTREVHNCQRTIRLPIHAVETLFKLRRITEELYKASGKVPSLDEVSAAAGVEPDKTRRLLMMSGSVSSIDAPIEGNETLRVEMIASPHVVEPDDDRAEQFAAALEHCHPIEREVLMLRANGATLPEVAEVLGLSRQGASNYVKRAIQRVQEVVGV
jgi:RNA polymerase primary sigma factor